MTRFLVLIALVAISACAAESGANDADVHERATVVETEAGTILCEGEIRESAPPQCDGPVIANWDWEDAWAFGEAPGRWGEFCFEASRDGDEVTVEGRPRPAGTCDRTEYTAVATVLEDASHGPQLCLGGIMLSYPAQCGGPDIPNWDWERIEGATTVNATTDGQFVVHGVWDDGTFTLTRRPRPATEADVVEAPDIDFTTPCPEPEGGWFPAGRPPLGEDAVGAAATRLEKLPGYGGLWVDNRDPRAAEGSNDPNLAILNVRMAGDRAEAERVIGQIWPGALCVVEAKRTQAELDRIRDDVFAEVGSLMLSGGVSGEVVEVTVVVDEDGAWQALFDERHGKGVVEVRSALQVAGD